MRYYFYQCVKIIIYIDSDRERDIGTRTHLQIQIQIHKEHIILICNENHMNDDIQSIPKTLPSSFVVEHVADVFHFHKIRIRNKKISKIVQQHMHLSVRLISLWSENFYY